jgi:hypothetical protein
MGALWMEVVVSSILCGLVGYVFAKKTGRNPALSVAVGVILNVFGLVVISFLGSQRQKRDS